MKDRKCPFELRYTYQKDDQRFIFNPKSEIKHNHELIPRTIINEEVITIIKSLLISKNHTPKEIHEKINLKFDKEFDYNQVRNIYYRIKSSLFGSPNYEAQELVNLLKVLKDLKLINYSVKIGQEKKNLEAVVFSSNGMIDLYKQYKDMIILDTTFGLNRFNMPLLTMTGVNNNGQTIIFCYAIIQDETCGMKKWVFEEFKKFSNEEPDAIISDGCPAFANAIKEVFPNTKHYLCAWHIQQNLKKHFSGLKRSTKKSNFCIDFILFTRYL